MMRKNKIRILHVAQAAGVMAILMSSFMVMVYIFPWFGCDLVMQEWIIVGGWGMLGLIFTVICKSVYKEKYGLME